MIGYKEGDSLKCVKGNSNLIINNIYTFQCYGKPIDGSPTLYVKELSGEFYTYRFVLVETTTNGGYMNDFKAYLSKHKDLLFTVGVLLLLDHVIFKGAFREKLKGIVDGVIGKAKASLDKPE